MIIKPLSDCPKRHTHNFVIEFAVVTRESCRHCDYLTQRRTTPLVSGGGKMIERLVYRALENDESLPALGAILQQQLARVRRREAKIANRNNGGSPKEEEDWQ